jgi:hypothetical protein
MDYKPKKGDLVYLPSNIMIMGEGLAQNNSVPDRWLNLIEPVMAVVVEPNYNNESIYHKIHLKGDNWLVRTIDTLEVVTSDKRNRSI